jgi:hypothetical protein
LIEQFECSGVFDGRGGSLQSQLEEVLDLGFGSCGEGGSAFCKCAGLMEDERVIHQEECLLGDGGFAALWNMQIGVGKVEESQGAREELAVHQSVNRAAVGEGGREQIPGLATWCEIKLTGSSEEGIAEFFEGESTAGHPPEQSVGGIAIESDFEFCGAGGTGGLLAPDGGIQKESMEFAEAVAFADKPRREPVEEFGV